jgi:hypothetical protein
MHAQATKASDILACITNNEQTDRIDEQLTSYGRYGYWAKMLVLVAARSNFTSSRLLLFA